MWDALNDDARQLVLDAARPVWETVAIFSRKRSRSADFKIRYERCGEFLDGVWNAKKTLFACNVDTVRVPKLGAQTQYLPKTTRWRRFQRLHVTSGGTLVVPVLERFRFNRRYCWAAVGRIMKLEHGKYGAFHGVDRSSTELAFSTNCVLYNTDAAPIVSVRELRNKTLDRNTKMRSNANLTY